MAMWLLCILSLAASFLLPATGEVVRSFSTCSQFFLGGNPPTNLVPENPARICQRYDNQYRFATMYDKNRRIPWFSAYMYNPGGGERHDEWRIEPQLALPRNQRRKNMELEWNCGICCSRLVKSQAICYDYQDTNIYDRGHLAPVCHQPNEKSKNATFSLTNIVPQFHELNQGQWKAYENDMRTYTEGCLKTYVIVGAAPGTTTLNNRVVIPTHIWAAFCCLFPNQTKTSKGFYAVNDQNQVNNVSLNSLEGNLKTFYNTTNNIDLFNGACY